MTQHDFPKTNQAANHVRLILLLYLFIFWSKRSGDQEDFEATEYCPSGLPFDHVSYFVLYKQSNEMLGRQCYS